MRDKVGNKIENGCTINVAGLETKVTGFSKVMGQKMVDTEYGSFNPSCVEVLTNKNYEGNNRW